ncbi:MAG: hypothetical protein HQK52_19830 [Oligoflexia bacterium]|nr:hypothetical protein [Oligoflexia bacterium]
MFKQIVTVTILTTVLLSSVCYAELCTTQYRSVHTKLKEKASDHHSDYHDHSGDSCKWRSALPTTAAFAVAAGYVLTAGMGYVAVKGVQKTHNEIEKLKIAREMDLANKFLAENDLYQAMHKLEKAEDKVFNNESAASAFIIQSQAFVELYSSLNKSMDSRTFLRLMKLGNQGMFCHTMEKFRTKAVQKLLKDKKIMALLESALSENSI